MRYQVAAFEKQMQSTVPKMETGSKRECKAGSKQSEKGPNQGWNQAEDAGEPEEDSKGRE